jgi:hypothetical protein
MVHMADAGLKSLYSNQLGGHHMVLDASLIFWILVSAAGILFAIGMIKKSWKAFLWSGLTIFPPAIYFFGAENWFMLIVLVPLIPCGIAFIMAKNRVTD